MGFIVIFSACVLIYLNIFILITLSFPSPVLTNNLPFSSYLSFDFILCVHTCVSQYPNVP